MIMMKSKSGGTIDKCKRRRKVENFQIDYSFPLFSEWFQWHSPVTNQGHDPQSTGANTSPPPPFPSLRSAEYNIPHRRHYWHWILNLWYTLPGEILNPKSKWSCCPKLCSPEALIILCYWIPEALNFRASGPKRQPWKHPWIFDTKNVWEVRLTAGVASVPVREIKLMKIW